LRIPSSPFAYHQFWGFLTLNVLTQVILPLILAFMMFTMGVTLVLDDFRRVAKFPKAFFLGSFLQLISLPVLAFLLASAWLNAGYIRPEFAVGLIIIAACPGGVTSNLMTHISKGDTALSISLTAIISLISVLTIPLIVNLGLSRFLSDSESAQLPLGTTVVGIFAITTVPVILGMITNAKFPQWCQQNEPWLAKAAGALLFLLIVAAMAKDWKLLQVNFAAVGPLTLSLNMVTMAMAYGVSRLVRLNRPQSVAITFECGLQNGALGIFVSLTLLKSTQMMMPCAIYSLLMMVTGTILMLVFAKQNTIEGLA
jgi:bile acid:Na+ symporter, BASS family